MPFIKVSLKTTFGRFSLLPFHYNKPLPLYSSILSSAALSSTMMTHGHSMVNQDQHPLDQLKSRERQFQLLDKEHMILVDEHDQYRGVASKRDCHTWANIEHGDDMLHRAFSVFMFNRANELLMQKRASTKVTFPGLWSNTCCSHPLHDLPEEMESDWPTFIGVKRAARRKLIDELGMHEHQLPLEKFTFVARVLYKARSGLTDWGEHELDHILFIRTDAPMVGQAPNREEVEQVQFVSKEKLTALMTSGRKIGSEEEYRFTPWFRMICEAFLLNDWWNKIDTIGSNSVDKTIYKL